MSVRAVDYLRPAVAAAAERAGAVKIELVPREKGDANKPNVELLIARMKAAGVSAHAVRRHHAPRAALLAARAPRS